MMKHTDMIQLIGDLCIEEFIAGGKTDIDSVKSARAMRARLFDAVRELYQELEFESCEREQYQIDLKKATDKIDELNTKILLQDEDVKKARKELANLRDQVRSQQETIRKLTLTDPENPDSPSWSDYAPGAEDMEPELRDCLPFPDVEDLEGASGLLGGDE